MSEGDTAVLTLGIKGGIAKVIPSTVWKSTGKHDDATQDAWVRLLEEKAFDPKSAYLAGMRAGTDVLRKGSHEVVNSQVEMSEGSDDFLTTTADRVDPSDAYRRNLDGWVGTHIDEEQDRLRRVLLQQFRTDQPEDYAFLIGYVARVGRGQVRFRKGRLVSVSRRGAHFTVEERKRAHDIILRLRRLESSEINLLRTPNFRHPAAIRQ